jgi:hypothetical protein
LTDTSCVVEATIGILIFQKGMVFLYTIILKRMASSFEYQAMTLTGLLSSLLLAPFS